MRVSVHVVVLGRGCAGVNVYWGVGSSRVVIAQVVHFPHHVDIVENFDACATSGQFNRTNMII